MKLYEFFGALNVNQSPDKNEDGVLSKEEREQFKNDLFYYILDHDKIHKENFYDVTEEIFKDKECKEDVWSPIVKRGCMDYYRDQQLKDDPKDIFTDEFQEDMCKMFDDHYRKDILKGEYHSKVI
jgi:hypothetical protein